MELLKFIHLETVIPLWLRHLSTSYIGNQTDAHTMISFVTNICNTTSCKVIPQSDAVW